MKAFSKENLLFQTRGRDALINEIMVLKKLDHPNIIKLYEVYETDNSVYLVLELIEGGELFEAIKEKGSTFFELDVRILLKNLLGALDYMHDR